MTLLVLGGTGEAKRFARSLHERGLSLIYSVAGILPGPALPFTVRSGGFSHLGSDSVSGLAHYLQDQRITAIADLTHPYAAAMSRHAQAAGERVGIPCWRYQRPAWKPEPADDWRYLADEEALLEQLMAFNRPLFTIGQSAYTLLDRKHRQPAHQHWTIRSGLPPQPGAMAHNLTAIQALGPFALADEQALLQRYRIDCLVAKQSGGAATEAKLIAAREAKLPVLFLQRPRLPEVSREFDDLDAFIRFCSPLQANQKRSKDLPNAK